MQTAHTLRGEGFDASEDGTGRGTPLVPVAFAENSRHEIHLEGSDGQRTGALSTGGGKPGQGVPMIAFPANLSGTQCASSLEVSPSLGALNPTAVATQWAVRRLTPLECERLMGFPDGHTGAPHKGKPAADGPRYRALGNSWAVNCARWIGERIASVDCIAAGDAA